MIIKFLGAAREVTGSKHLIITRSGKRILLDCGMFQGKGLETDTMNRDLGFEPSELDHIVLTHAHIDHSGLIPYVYKLGFRGSVICTHATRDLCAIMLADAGHIQEHDTYTFNKKRAKQGLEPVEPIYTRVEALESMVLFLSIPYNRKLQVDDNIKVKFTNTGHMLGSGVANIEIKENGKLTRIAYTGDIGRPANRILKAPEDFPQTDILVTESTYGNRLHEDNTASEEKLLKVVNETCVDKGGKLIIPSFSVGRTQEIVYSLNNFYNDRLLPKVEIFVDSPLAINATNIFRLHPECFNKKILEVMETDPDPFGFNTLSYLLKAEDSKKLNDITKPCIIISASGMMEAGRVKHHLAHSISDARNTVLAVGYCAPQTLGARILRGDKQVSIHGNLYQVNADIRRIDSYSGHGDYNEMLRFLECQDASQITRSFIVHGEEESQKSYREKMMENGFKDPEIPARWDEYEI